jgi:hypothetical protein
LQSFVELLGLNGRRHFLRTTVTEDIDLLLTPTGLEHFRKGCLGLGYRPAFAGAKKTFRHCETGIRIKIITSGEFPGDGRPKPVAFPDPAQPGVVLIKEGLRVISLEKLVELKLASGQSAPHRRRDLADVQDLIRLKRLPLEFADNLDNGVAELYREIWNETQQLDPFREEEP